jgi:hypothetical protein
MTGLLDAGSPTKAAERGASRRWKNDLYWLGRILWACRVSAASAIGGLLLFGWVDQAQNLFADRSFDAYFLGAHYWLAVFGATFLVWAFPVHYAARRVLEDGEKAWMIPYRLRREMSEADARALRAAVWRRYEKSFIAWTPRALGLLPFLAVALGLLGARGALADADALSVTKETERQISALLALDALFAAGFVVFVVFRRGLARRMSSRIDLDRLAMASLCVTSSFFLLALAWPFFLSDHAPRALLVPFLFGSLVLAASWLVRKGYETGAPLLLLAIVVAAGLTAANTHLNDVRTLPDGARPKTERQIELSRAVARWKAANGCDDRCPPALIVAAEGGASRAAFMAATVIGELIDHEPSLRDADSVSAPGRRIFALSGVSGGAFGAATIRAALADAAEVGSRTPPCVNSARVWFGDHATRRDTFSWRECLQLLVSGDYLSPAFVGLGFRDNLSPRRWLVGAEPWMEDRAALLEKAWERHYEFVTNPAYKDDYWSGTLIQTGRVCEAGSTKGLCRRFGYAVDTPQAKWTPLLLLNGTSVASGARIIASDLVSTRRSEFLGCATRAPLYPAAFDVFEMLSHQCASTGASTGAAAKAPPEVDRCGAMGGGDICRSAANGGEDRPEARDGPDMLLSTSALLSARFPIISPAGTLRSLSGVDDGDRVVDGGYFENAGLTTALDIARALRSEGITPLILWVQNDPAGQKTDETLPPRAAGGPKLGKTGVDLVSGLFGLFAAPVDTLLATRAGHAAEEAALAQRSLEEMNAVVDAAEAAKGMTASFFQIGVRVAPQLAPNGGPSCAQFADGGLAMAKVSMSWWLSQSVQADLDAQLCDKGNIESLDNLMTRLRQRLPLEKATY